MLKVLIADDSAIVRERLAATILEIEGVELVGQAEDGIQATASAQELEPHLVILDIRMPGRNGIEALSEIKKTNPNTLVMVLTSYPYPQYIKKCLDEGADYFLDKATQIGKVTEIIKELVN